MKKNIFSFVLTLFLFTVLSSCEKYIDKTSPGMRNVFGEWNWIMSTGGFAGDTLLASESQEKVWLSFDFEGNYVKFINDNGVDYQKYYFVKKPSILSSITLGQIEYGNGILQSVKMPHIDTLYLIDEVEDGYNNIYVRKK